MYAPRSRRPRVAALVLAAIVVLAVGLWFGGHPSWLPGPLRSAFTSQGPSDKLVNQVIGLLSKDYYRKIDRTDLVNKGLAAAVASLRDPYSHYYDPADYHSFQNETDPQLSGIGVEPAARPGGLLVQQVIDHSPAAKAGLTAGDLIIRVGSTSLANRSQGFSSGLIRGRAGTRVRLTVQRGSRRREVTIVRATIAQPVAGAGFSPSRAPSSGTST